MRISIIVTARNEDPAILDATLGALEATTRHLPTEVIVVDDGSSVPVKIGSRYDRLMRHPEAVGVCPARREGARIATGDVLVWLDAHMSFGEGWLEQLVVHADSKKLVCSTFWSYDLSKPLAWGADFHWNVTRDYRAQRYPGFTWKHRTTPPEHALVDVPMVLGACYMMRRDAYEHLGGFNPHFRVWGLGELDISARAWFAGFGVACATHAKVGHLSRKAFPYSVRFEHLEFNQAVTMRSVFASRTVDRLASQFELPREVEAWLAQTELGPWRRMIQRRRKMKDAEFFARFVPQLAP